MLEVRNLNCGYGKRRILQDVSFGADYGDIVCILGSNGSGKSTLIKTIVGLLKPHDGDIRVDGSSIKDWSCRRRAELISYIPQRFNSMFKYRCEDIVLMGRNPHLGIFSCPAIEDGDIVDDVMKILGISYLKNKIYSRISGGERQLVKIAQALVQQSRIIIMDEPANSLDFGNQIIMLKHLGECARMGIMVIMVTHFLNHAFLYGTKALLIKDGGLTEVEKPCKNLEEIDLRNLYGIEVKVVEMELESRRTKVCLPIF